MTAVTDFQTYLDVQALHARYAEILDRTDFSDWPDLFTPVCSYTVQSRENHDAGLPLCILRMESQGMLRDRVYGALKTIYHDPYYQRHIVSQALSSAPTVTACPKFWRRAATSTAWCARPRVCALPSGTVFLTTT
jgi:hypothetical protein